ncbi:MAG TPA: VOC family protein [Vicinamibacterales bacterium]
MASTKRSQARSRKTARPAARKAVAKRRTAKAAAKGLQLRSGAPGLTVNDIATSMTWYCDILGFAVKERWERDGVLHGGELTAGGASLFIGQDDWKKGRDRVKGEGVRLYLHVKTARDVDRLAADIKTRGGALASEPHDDWGVRSFNLEDPTGYKITVSSEG